MYKFCLRCYQFLTLLACLILAQWTAGNDKIRVGIIGCDTSHAIAFPKVINALNAKGAAAKVQVVAAYPGGSPDIPSSRDRVQGFTQDLESMGIEIVDDIPALESRCDAYLLESVDGRVHLEQFRAIATGKPVFIDKPAAASLEDVIAIFNLAKQTNTPCFSSSALRYCTELQKIKGDKSIGSLTGVTTSCPLKTEPHHPDFYWYGIHGAESLFALMGTGCGKVSCQASDKQCVALGKWRDGRTGVLRGLIAGPRGRAPFTYTLYGEQGIRHAAGFSGYKPLVVEICEFFVNRKPPVTREETLEIFAFMDAAEMSMKNDGQPVDVQQVLNAATVRASAP